MRFVHLADLHLGKSMHGVSLIDHQDQPQWVERFLKKMDEVQPDAVVIAGDVYDRSSPSGDAMLLFDHMLTELAARKIAVMVIAGNHDSGKKLSFGESLLSQNGIYISGMVKKELTHITLQEKDGNGEVTFWLMPYLFPALAAQVLEDPSIRDYGAAAAALLSAQPMDPGKRNVLIAHQNVTSQGKEVERGGSESMVGGVGQIDYHVFDAFDYVALGHIHAAYPSGRKEVRYAGSPLCYHFDELKQPRKGPLLVEIGDKEDGQAEIKTTLLEIAPLHPLREIRGCDLEIRKAEETSDAAGEYIRIVLTDRRVTPTIAEYYRQLYASKGSILMELVSSYREQLGMGVSDYKAKDMASRSLTELFSEFYSNRMDGVSVTEEERFVLERAEKITQEQSGQMDARGSAGASEIEVLLKELRRSGIGKADRQETEKKGGAE